MNLFSKTAAELLELLKNRDISAREIVTSVFNRIESVDSKVNAFAQTDKESALKQADAIDKKRSAGEPLGMLAGIPVALKDNLCRTGYRTSCGSKILSSYKAVYNATVVQKLITADAVFIGNANMDEFAMGSSCERSIYGATHNPWNISCAPGGSSGGSAAAVAADETILALGSDTGGSIRQPASFCGIVGLKPTYGLVSRFGLIAYASSLDQIGPLTKDVYDSALLLENISGYDPSDSTSIKQNPFSYTSTLKESIKGLRIGIPQEYFIGGLDSEVASHIQSAIKLLAECGAEIIDISLPHTEYAVATYYIIATAEASSNLARFDGVRYGYRTEESSDLHDMYFKTRSEGFGDEVKRRILLGTYVLSSGYYDAYYKKAQQVRTLICRDFENAFQKVDCIITPTAPSPAFKISEKIDDPLTMYLSDIFTISVNLAGLPGISIPCGFSSSRLPIGMQIIGKPLGEQTILRCAYTFERNTPFRTMKPTLE
ncbi:MAG: Asp-tRNA(Asn)/Glu-tRNA(Gln) amidotransferase subunit GatA [bacterium]|nr:Asp-tRNA(Asn)/Glu-tRNA(Gln) amidotransferase subunit GatA [bacterium]